MCLRFSDDGGREDLRDATLCFLRCTLGDRQDSMQHVLLLM